MVLGSIGISTVVDVGAADVGSSVVGSVAGLSVGATSVAPGEDTVAPEGVAVPCMVVAIEDTSVTESEVDSVGNSVGASSVEELVCSVGNAVLESGMAVDGS